MFSTAFSAIIAFFGTKLGQALIALALLALILWSAYGWAFRRGESAEAVRTAQLVAESRLAAMQWETDGLQARVDLVQCQNQWLDVQVTAARQIQAAQVAHQQAERDAKEWRSRWESRPQGCQAALLALDLACVGIEAY